MKYNISERHLSGQVVVITPHPGEGITPPPADQKGGEVGEGEGDHQ